MPRGRIQALIDLKALRHNCQIARNNANDQLLAVIKANAYGHGLEQAAAALSDMTDMLAVTDLREAQLLKQSSPEADILILQGLMDISELDVIAREGFQLVVHSLPQLDAIDQRLKQRPPGKPLTLWLKMDSGMGRLGIAPGDYAKACKALAGRPYCREVVMMTHLANSSLPDSSLNTTQLKQFAKVEKKLRSDFPRLPTSIPASGGLLGPYDIESSWARPGIMLYGSSPFPWELKELRAEQLGLLPVMHLRSKLIAVKDLKAGDNVGYGSQYICKGKTKVGIVSCGYADGYPSCAPNGTPVLVNDKRSRTLGRISMDMLAVDLTDLPTAQVGDPVTLWGKGLPADEVAAHTGILSYNLFCSITRRVQFEYDRQGL